MATSAACFLLLGFLSSIGGTDAQSLECRGDGYGFIKASAFSVDYINAVVPGHNFYSVRPCLFNQTTHPPTAFLSLRLPLPSHIYFPQTPHARTRNPCATESTSPFEALMHFWLSFLSLSLQLLFFCARAFSLFAWDDGGGGMVAVAGFGWKQQPHAVCRAPTTHP
jgi:hypothetical protein